MGNGSEAGSVEKLGARVLDKANREDCGLDGPAITRKSSKAKLKEMA